MSKCDNCLIMAHVKEEMEKRDGFCACAWYIDNVVCGDKTIDECPEFKEVEQ